MNHRTLAVCCSLFCVAALVIVFLGLWNMVRGGDGNLSQRLMRLRVISQAIAIALLVAAMWFFGRGGGG